MVANRGPQQIRRAAVFARRKRRGVGAFSAWVFARSTAPRTRAKLNWINFRHFAIAIREVLKPIAIHADSIVMVRLESHSNHNPSGSLPSRLTKQFGKRLAAADHRHPF